MTDAVDHWHDDLLERRQYADFLTTYLERKCVPGESGIVIALDAPWGLGKSFFMERWAKDLTAAGRAVVTFNSWENDSADSPVVAFMGELRSSLRPLYDKVPKAHAVRQGLETRTKEALTNLRKATFPTLAIVGKSILKKTTGVAVDEVMEAFDGTADPESVLDAAAEATPEALEKGLDAFFEKALQGHTERMESVKAFRRSLEDLLSFLHGNDLAAGPLYVFIDELDRCRPDYAIRLLEGIKHLFSVKGVAFVVSTNLAQLGSAVGAVYGPAFDGFGYLKRFFDFEYDLPQPTRNGFIRSQITGTALANLQGPSGLDPRGNSAYDASEAFTAVAEAMRLDLRTLQRVVYIADAAVSGAPRRAPFVAIWLFFLAVLRHTQPDTFLKVAAQSMTEAAFIEMVRQVMPGSHRVPSMHEDEHGRYVQRDADLPTALAILYEITKQTQRDLVQRVKDENAADLPYPHSLRRLVFETWRIQGNARSPLNEHAELIAAAGHIKRPSPGK